MGLANDVAGRVDKFWDTSHKTINAEIRKIDDDIKKEIQELDDDIRREMRGLSDEIGNPMSCKRNRKVKIFDGAKRKDNACNK
jgi:hypothetical protein